MVAHKDRGAGLWGGWVFGRGSIWHGISLICIKHIIKYINGEAKL